MVIFDCDTNMITFFSIKFSIDYLLEETMFNCSLSQERLQVLQRGISYGCEKKLPFFYFKIIIRR